MTLLFCTGYNSITQTLALFRRGCNSVKCCLIDDQLANLEEAFVYRRKEYVMPVRCKIWCVLYCARVRADPPRGAGGCGGVFKGCYRQLVTLK